jgi:hypothetical protein
MSLDNLPVYTFAGATALQDDYSDIPGQSAVFLKGERLILNPEVINHQQEPDSPTLTLFSPVNIAGNSSTRPSKFMAWVPGVGLISMQRALAAPARLLVSESGFTLTFTTGTPIALH